MLARRIKSSCITPLIAPIPPSGVLWIRAPPSAAKLKVRWTKRILPVGITGKREVSLPEPLIKWRIPKDFRFSFPWENQASWNCPRMRFVSFTFFSSYPHPLRVRVISPGFLEGGESHSFFSLPRVKFTIEHQNPPLNVSKTLTLKPVNYWDIGDTFLFQVRHNLSIRDIPCSYVTISPFLS